MIHHRLLSFSTTLLLLLGSMQGVLFAAAPSGDALFQLEIEGPAEGLIGNGVDSVVVAKPVGFHFHRGNGGDGKFNLSRAGKPVDLGALSWRSIAFPGGIVFVHRDGNNGIEIFQTALPDDPYGVLMRFSGTFSGAKVEIEGGQPLQPRNVPVEGPTSKSVLGFSQTGKIANADFDTLRADVLRPYTERGMVLRSPDRALDQAVLFNQYLLDLSYDGRLIVCELFRYADIWSRDLGSGFVPGAIFTNRIEAAKKCIEVDLERHETATARALKTTGDASQGGSAEGVGHLITALWDYYLITGDHDYLARVADGLRPWVDAWLARDYARTGLIVDTTDWMDHSRYQMLPFGARTLYANAQFLRLLATFSRIETDLGHAEAAQRYAADRDRVIAAINDRLWSESLGAYGNLRIGDQIDERTASAANSLALLGGAASPARAAKVLATLKAKNGRPNGTLTITPLMTYYPESDQNEKIWPWWVAYEAMARFQNGDPDGGIRLLDTCAATINNPRYPGMMDETMDRDGHSEGGRAFATAAGSLLTSIYKGLFGIEILAGGMAEVKVIPNLPSKWNDASLHQPTPGGFIEVEVRKRVPYITVKDPRIKVVQTTVNAVVIGAEKKVWKAPAPLVGKSVAPLPTPAWVARSAALFDEPGFPSAALPVPAGPTLPRLSWADLGTLDAKRTGALIIRGNALPFLAPDGRRVQDLLDGYLANGGMLIFSGATMLTNQGDQRVQLGGDGGVIEWYDHESSGWFPVHPRTGAREAQPRRDGTIYWESGPYFGGWDIERGAFGFLAAGKGLHLAPGSPLTVKKGKSGDQINAAFTDFSVSSPWYFQALATTHTSINFLIPARGEELSCVARLVNRDSHGEIILIAAGAESSVEIASLLRPYPVGK